MSHPGFDADYWEITLGRDAVEQPNISWPPLDRALFCDSPISVVVAEHYRRRAIEDGGDLEPKIPVDRFVFGRGEPPERHLTKINGLPYRPKNRPWPHDVFGRPMTFLAQFCFMDSRDHMGTLLPGDVLVVFMRTMRAYLVPEIVPVVDPCDDRDALIFEWYSLGIDNLVASAPAPAVGFPTCFGVRHRSWDCTNEASAVAALSRVVPQDVLPQHEFSTAATLRGLARHPQMKIGGVPFWYHPPDTENRMTFLGSLSGVNPIHEFAFPFVNERRALEMDESLDAKNLLIFHDGCCLNFFLQDDGEVQWEADFL